MVRAAPLLAARAAGEEPRVALLLSPLPEAWIALWAAEAAGVAVPINHALADEHLQALLQAARVNVIVPLTPGHVAGDIGTSVQRLADRPVRQSWAKLLERVFEIDMERCPNCGGELKIIAAILEGGPGHKGS